jgi:hypothetical protein
MTYRNLRSRQLFLSTAVFTLVCSARADELPLARVVLSTSGVAQFTHSGPVSAGSTVDLSVRLDQVDDILKSLTVFDKEGAIGAVSLPGKTPLAELFRDLPFGLDALDSPSALLNALRGTEVEIAGQITAKGRVLRVEAEDVSLPDTRGVTKRHRLTLMTDRGLVQAILEDLNSLRFVEPQTESQIGRALTGLTENRAKDRRRLSIGFLGERSRNVAISYMVAAPIWKTAYRMVLPREGTSARLQGWAVVENLTGGDWNDIELVLVSGNPVALRQPLYTALFADRVEIPVSAGARIVPRTDARDERQVALRAPAVPPNPPRAFAAAPSAALRSGSGNAVMGLAAPGEPPPSTLGGAANAAEAEEASTQLLFHFPAKISLETGHTMMIPFIDREVFATRVWVYQPETSARHPLAAVRVRNDAESGLPPGIVTAYEVVKDGGVNFVGDAELALLPRGAFKFVTFALDSKTEIRRDDQGIIRTQLGKAINGTLTLTTRSRRSISYEITAPADEDRQIIIEEARAEGWTPAREMSGVEETPTRFRYAVGARKGETAKTTLVLERMESQTVILTTLAAEDILAHIRPLQNESAVLKDTVAKLSAIVNDIIRSRSQRSQLETERKKIVDDQNRVRQNLQSVGPGSDLGRRYLDNLKSQEDRLAEIDRLDKSLEHEMEVKRTSAEQLTRSLNL